MPDRLVPIEQMLAARELIGARLHRTPILSSRTAADIAQAAGAGRPEGGRINLKAEHLQVTGSFKPRGMVVKIAGLNDQARRAGIITMSAGNAGQGYAWAAREAGVPAVITMPVGAVRSKVEACVGYGAEVVLHGEHVGETLARLHELEAERGLTFCHPFDDPAVIAGFGSIGLEILEELPDVDVVVAGIGGGGLISGVAGAIKQRRPSVRVYGVEPEQSNAMSLALERGEVTTIQPQSVADGLGAPFAGEWTMAMCRRYVDAIVLLDDPTILAGVRFAAERMKQVLEPAGAAALAAVLTGRISIRDGETVCVIASGGNIAIERLGELLTRATPLTEAHGTPLVGRPT